MACFFLLFHCDVLIIIVVGVIMVARSQEINYKYLLHVHTKKNLKKNSFYFRIFFYKIILLVPAKK